MQVSPKSQIDGPARSPARDGKLSKNADNTRANVNTSAANVAAANLKAQVATVQRLQELTAFERIAAPFGGVITARTVDVGDLVTADPAGGSTLLTIQRDDVLRVMVDIPQSSAVSLRDGLSTEVRVPELPGQIFYARVVRNSVALDPASRTLLVEVDVDNQSHKLQPGLYVDVSFAIPRQTPGIVLPDDALVFNAAGMQVAVVRPDGTVEMRKVSIYRDFGTSVEIREGLSGGERLVLRPPADLSDGSRVKIADQGQKETPRQKPAVDPGSSPSAARKGPPGQRSG
jgi:HlyD family secretion protein